jgi:ribosome small subunit-dependent GTPase A
MPVDPMRLFDDLNPNNSLSAAEVLKNVCRFINENEKETERLFYHIEQRSTNHNTGSPTMTLRDLRKEQTVCRRLLKMKEQTKHAKEGAKEMLRSDFSEQYIHKLRVIRIKQLMEEPDVAEAKRAQLEFWLDESHQRGKKAGLHNALLQDIEDGLETPIGAINANPGMLIAHKKMLKRSKGTIDPILFNAKSGRMFSNDRLNPLIKYEKVLQRRGQRRKASLKRLALEEDYTPTELATINAAREGNRLLSYLGTHGAGSTSIHKDMQDLLKRQANLLEQQKEMVDMDVGDEQDVGVGNDDDDDDTQINVDGIKLDSQGKPVKGKQFNPKKKPTASGESTPALREERKRVIDTQLATINKQISNLITKKEDFDQTQHVRHDAKDSSLVHIANQPYVYCRVVAAYGQTVVVEQCGSNSYMKHAQFFVQDELEQIQRAAGVPTLQLDNRDNLDHQPDDEFDEQGNARDGQLTIPGHQRKPHKVRANRRRWHCIKSRHLDLLCGDYVFIDPAPGRAWTSGAHESTSASTLASMNNTGADDHGVVKATFSRLNLLQKSGRSTSKLQHLEESNPVCSNIDNMVILCAAEGQPAFSTSLIDRYLAAAQFAGIKATIVYNKIDLIEMVSEAEKILSDLKEQRLTVHEKEKSLKKKLGKKDFRKMKQRMLKDQKKKLKDTHFYTTTMQRYQNKLLYSDALAKELQQLDEEDEYQQLVEDQNSQTQNVNKDDIYEEDEHGRLTLKTAPSKNKKDYSVPALIKRQNDPTLMNPEKRVNALDYYYNDEEYDDEEEDRVLLEQQLEKWINKKKRQSSREVEEKLREYERIGVKVIRCSARTGVGIDELDGLLSRFHSTGFVGQSGVGKSSLLNAIIPDLDLQTSSITVQGKGQHTTTSSRMFHLPNGGSVIDTPGSQGFIPPAVEPDYVQELFPEIKALAKYCKLAGKCMHTKEVGCAVREAVGDGSNRAIIPVTITELFDPLLMNNIRVAEFRARLENGEIREIAEKYAGNDPVLLYAKRFYRDLDAGKILTSNVHTHIPLDTAVDLGAKVELDESGQAMLHANEEVLRTHRAKTSAEYEKAPANVIPLEESDIESDGNELPYNIRKLKHANRELSDIIEMKLTHFGDDAQYTDEEDEIIQNEMKIQDELDKYYALKRYQAGGGTIGDENDPYVAAKRQRRENRRLKREKLEEERIKNGEFDKFDLNFDYNIEAMTQEILRVQKSDLVFEAEHLHNLDHVGDGGKQLKDDIYQDARRTAIALAEIDLQDRLKKHQERKQKRQQYQIEEANQDAIEEKERMENDILKFRAHKLGITVEQLLEYQELVKKQRDAEFEEKEQREAEHKAKYEQFDKQSTDQEGFAIDTVEDMEGPREAVFERIIDPNAPEESHIDYNKPSTGKPQTKKERYAELQRQAQDKNAAKFAPHPSILKQLAKEEGEGVPGALEYAGELIFSQREKDQLLAKEHRESNAPYWRKERDRLTQRRFGSKLPADANAYIPQFRYDNYISMVNMMQKTEEFLEKRKKKKSLTKQEEEKIKKREKQAELFEKRQIERRRLLADQDPFGVRQDMQRLTDKTREDTWAELTPAQMNWFSAKLAHTLPNKLTLLEGKSDQPIRKGVSDKTLNKEQYANLLTNPNHIKDDDDDAETRAFQHEMLTNMSAIYDERRKDYQNIDTEGQFQRSTAEHWQRSGHLRSSWDDINKMTEKRDRLSRLQQDDKLARQKFGGIKNTYGEQWQSHVHQYSDEDNDAFEMRRNQQAGGDNFTKRLNMEMDGFTMDDLQKFHNSGNGPTH